MFLPESRLLSVYHMYAWCCMSMVCVPYMCLVSVEATDVLDPPWGRGYGGWELPRGCWKLNPSPPEAQPALWTAETFLQPRQPVFIESLIQQ